MVVPILFHSALRSSPGVLDPKVEPLVVFFYYAPATEADRVHSFLQLCLHAFRLCLDPYPVKLCTYVDDRFDPDRWLLFKASTRLYWGIDLILITRSSISSPGWLFYLGTMFWLWMTNVPHVWVFYWAERLTVKINTVCFYLFIGQNDWLWTPVLPLPVCFFWMIWILNYTSNKTLIMNFHVKRVIFSVFRDTIKSLHRKQKLSNLVVQNPCSKVSWLYKCISW